MPTNEASNTPHFLSIVVPVYREEGNLAKLVDALDTVTRTVPNSRWEYVFVNDGSPDGSLKVLLELARSRADVKVIDLSRNFGKELALSAGLAYASGEAIICMDADLQHPPSLVPRMVQEWRSGAEVVATVRKKTEGETLLRKSGSRLFYWVMSQISEVEMASQTTDFRLLDANVAAAMRSIGERQRMFRGLVDWLGFRKVWLEFESPAREQDEGNYSLKALAGLAINSFISYSSFPLRFVGYLGAFISMASGLLLIWMLIMRSIHGPMYYTPLALFVVGNTLLTGITLSSLGLIALYIRKILGETLRRPLFVVRETANLATHHTHALPTHSTES